MFARALLKNALLAAASALAAGNATVLAHAQQCAKERFEDTGYVVCSFDPMKSDLRLFWKSPKGEPYRTFSNVAAKVSVEGRELGFAVNAGMYRSDFSPLGLYVENGRQLRPVDTTSIDKPSGQVPNFYKKPNGVFFLAESGAGILPTGEFVHARRNVRFATQSGPMLVIANKLHPALIAGSADRTRRSGIGVCNNGLVRVAVSDDAVNFHDFARLFRDRLVCPNALFLDGGHGVGLYLPEMGRNDFSWHGGYGPILGLVK
ncbi:MAG: phosphodiester glycosidase family protein [Rhizobiaceae bacterium]|nr:phosphodiester glycosidase family protein [Rhizobiaceae bacterium]